VPRSTVILVCHRFCCASLLDFRFRARAADALESVPHFHGLISEFRPESVYRTFGQCPFV